MPVGMGPQKVALPPHPGNHLPVPGIPEKIAGKEKGSRYPVFLKNIQNFLCPFPEFIGRKDQADRFQCGIGSDDRPFAILYGVKKK